MVPRAGQGRRQVAPFENSDGARSVSKRKSVLKCRLTGSYAIAEALDDAIAVTYFIVVP